MPFLLFQLFSVFSDVILKNKLASLQTSVMTGSAIYDYYVILNKYLYNYYLLVCVYASSSEIINFLSLQATRRCSTTREQFFCALKQSLHDFSVFFKVKV